MDDGVSFTMDQDGRQIQVVDASGCRTRMDTADAAKHDGLRTRLSQVPVFTELLRRAALTRTVET
jgi:hypothetical protein